ncbi:MAG: PIG-L deacetylase family protein [bacterium]|nr:PIG-L deacetylase family protein [bacterium]
MAVGAHSDDIEISCGGTIAKAVKSGHEVLMVVMTTSEYTNYTGRVLRTFDEAEREGKKAAETLGAKLITLNFSTKDIPYNSESVEALDKIFNEFQPDIILTHWPHDTHQAHRNVALASISGGRHFNTILMYEPMMPSGRSYEGFRAQVYVDISEFNKIKMEALKAHKSQYKKYGGDFWLGAVEARARLRGFEMRDEIGQCKFAECYEVMRLKLSL